MPKVDAPHITATPRDTGGRRYVTIPETDLFDQPHPAIRVNLDSFGPGTHFLDAALADTVEERLKAYVRANVRILQPKRDAEAERAVNRSGSSAGAGIASTSEL